MALEGGLTLPGSLQIAVRPLPQQSVTLRQMFQGPLVCSTGRVPVLPNLCHTPSPSSFSHGMGGKPKSRFSNPACHNHSAVG